MNLVVNARDAMPDGGEIIIETASVHLDETYQRKHEPVFPGRYVMLSVSDSGCGMDETTKAHIFEPFFTTKTKGRGTGLGLSTVYGIVKQSGGYIWVYSEPGRGTTFKLFFPRVAEMAENLVRPVEESGSWAGSGTILLVEDDDSLRELLVATLQSASYRILEANTAAIELITAHKREVQLLLSDVVMPRMSGVSLPKLKAIFMSGYAPEMLSRRDPLPRNSLFIQKPFSKETLLSTIHGALL
jgi:two-component system cell cycle sensor histidine kinase/response regulator CckA